MPASRDSHKKVEHSLFPTPVSLAKMQRMYYFFLSLYISVYKSIPVLLSFFVCYCLF